MVNMTFIGQEACWISKKYGLLSTHDLGPFSDPRVKDYTKLKFKVQYIHYLLIYLFSYAKRRALVAAVTYSCPCLLYTSRCV